MTVVSTNVVESLAECSVALLEIEAQPSDLWLERAAEEIRRRLAPERVVTVMDGSATSSNGFRQITPFYLPQPKFAVAAPDAETRQRWKADYVAVAEETAKSVEERWPEISELVWGGLRTDSPEQPNAFRTISKRFGVRGVDYAVGPLATESAGPRALSLCLWTHQDEAPPVGEEAEVLVANVWRMLEASYRHLLATGVDERLALLDRLTEAQRQVAKLLLEGLSEKQIASRLGRSPYTTHDHVKAIYRAWGVRSRAEFMARWTRCCADMVPERVERT